MSGSAPPGAAALGHSLFPTLPVSKRWRGVVESVADGRDASWIADCTIRAGARQLQAAPGNAVYREAVRLLVSIPLAARAASFEAALRELGLPVGARPELADLLFAAGDRLDAVATRAGLSDDFGELARRALVAALLQRIGAELPSLLEATPEDVRAATRRYSDPREFTTLARSFFAGLVATTLSSYLDRALAGHVGTGRRFADLGERSRFDRELRTYCHETTRIIHEFSAGWYGRHVYGTGEMTPRAIAGYAAVALGKILKEMERREAVP